MKADIRKTHPTNINPIEALVYVRSLKCDDDCRALIASRLWWRGCTNEMSNLRKSISIAKINLEKNMRDMAHIKSSATNMSFDVRKQVLDHLKEAMADNKATVSKYESYAGKFAALDKLHELSLNTPSPISNTLIAKVNAIVKANPTALAEAIID